MTMSATSAPPTLNLRRILAVSLADIGDLVVTTPALRALRQRYPQAHIAVLTTAPAAMILTESGLADSVITFDKAVFDSAKALLNPRRFWQAVQLAVTLHKAKYDAVLIFHLLTTRFGALKYAALALATGAPIRAGADNGRGWFLTHRTPDSGFGVKRQVEYYLAIAATVGAEIPTTATALNGHLGISHADREWARAQIPAGANTVAIHAGSGGFSLARRWDLKHFATVADQLAANGYRVVFVGGKDDPAEAVIERMTTAATVPLGNLVGRTSLGQVSAILERCQAYVGADSGVMHLAAAVGIPAIAALFGPSNAAAWAEPSLRVVRSDVRCSPCSYIGRTVGLRHGCEARTCMKLITPDNVLASLKAAQESAPSVPHPMLEPPLVPRLHLLGVPIHALTWDGFLDQIGTWVTTRGNLPDRMPRQICTVNPEYIMTAQRDSLLFSILKRADICAPDGVGVLWAARRMGISLPARITGSDGVPKIAERAAREGWRIFLLGAGAGVAARTAEILCERYPALQIAGTYAGSASADAEDDLVAMIAASRADILFVAFGHGKQDHWIARNLPRLQVAIAMGVGGSFDFIAGVTERAPAWMQRAGLEWLHRLLREPWRWRRMLRLPQFVWAILWRGSRAPFAFSGGRP